MFAILDTGRNDSVASRSVIRTKREAEGEPPEPEQVSGIDGARERWKSHLSCQKLVKYWSFDLKAPAAHGSALSQ